MNQERVLMYWPINKPLPDGWVEACKMDGNHGKYSRIIELCRKRKKTKAEGQEPK